MNAGSPTSLPTITYWYEGICPYSGEVLRLPRTVEVEALAHALMQQLAADARFRREGKMYGVLWVETPSGQRQVLKAFSGLFNGQSNLEGWVPPISGRNRIALEEAQTLASLEQIKQEILTLKQIPERQQYEEIVWNFEHKLKQMNELHQRRKRERDQCRQQIALALDGERLAAALEQMNEQSRRDGMERRRLKQERDTVLTPLKQTIEQADLRVRQLKLRRKALSNQLQAQMHAAYQLTNFAGESLTIQALSHQGLPTGTGDCCAPKLLHYAATHHLKPLAMAEFWWGAAWGDKIPGHFYPACRERCQPILGFLLSGLPSPVAEPFTEPAGDLSLSILFEDHHLVAIDKPAGLLSVPGRYHNRQDSVLSRVRSSFPAALTVHRLDQDTSGILLVAKNRETYRCLSQQFQQRQVKKIYEALLAGKITADQGQINLPLCPDPADRPRQKVEVEQGKPSLTLFQVMERMADLTRIEFIPITGRTHQLRVHAATGLGVPILGDRLYGGFKEFASRALTSESTASFDLTFALSPNRLYLHAKELWFHHPQSGQKVALQSAMPF